MGNDASVNTKTKPQSRPSHGPTLPSNARLMNTAIKQRLSKGNAKSTYNMKVVIRGDRQTGKSALFHRLEGGGFIKEHRVTEQIACSHVLWPYKTSDEMVNLEIWDVVDKAIIPTNIVDDNNGIVKPSIVSKNLLPADATTIDVYKGAHAVIFMVDPTRKWTLEYVKKNISKIPDGIDCVVLFGKKDLNKLWTLTNGEIEEFMSSQPKNVRSLQISLQDCYGMKELHSFFNVPFLRMKAKYLQQELQRAEREYEQSKVELDIFINHQNYDEFLNRLKALKEQKNNKRKAPTSPTMAPAPKVKQTVRSSKDLPLIQEQQQKQEAKKKEEEIKKKQEIKKQENIDTFKPTGGLNDDFFADLVGNNDDDVDDDDKSEDEDTDIFQAKKPKQMQIVSPHDNEGENHKEGALLNGSHKKEDENTDNNDNNNSKSQNNGPGFDTEKNEDDKSNTEKIGFADSELNDDNKEINSNSLSNGNGQHNDKAKSEKMAYSRMPDLNFNNSNTSQKSGGKLQSLMKLQADIEETDSDDFDDEPLVLAAPKTIIKKPVQPIKVKPKAKPKMIEKQSDPIDTNKDTNNDQQTALDAFLDDLNSASPQPEQSPTSPKSPRSIKSNDDNDDDDDGEEDEDEEARRRRKEEKRRRKREKKEEKRRRRKEKKEKKKKKHKHGDSDDDNDSDDEEGKKRKKKHKKKKHKKKKHKEKDDDLVEYDDSNDSEEIVEIE